MSWRGYSGCRQDGAFFLGLFVCVFVLNEGTVDVNGGGGGEGAVVCLNCCCCCFLGFARVRSSCCFLDFFQSYLMGDEVGEPSD